MRLNGTYCETVLFFTTRCDALTHRTIQIHCLVTTCAWAVAVSGLRLPTAHAMRRWVCATTTLLMGWLIACLIAYR
ncbi:hypothetical protein ACFW2Y_28920 [Streptomyces sp. NPDC058877]|uniref:hypothetical protein n=1 Tax=unclassified Streptomyces TaxID=2593676 RepID=UPI0036B39DAD